MTDGERSIQADDGAGGGAGGGDGSVTRGLDVALRGSLPCIACGYDLRGVTIRGVCPECGTAVRATILYRVDPQAEEFKALCTPRLTALALIVWPVAGLAAVLLVWLLRSAEVMRYVLGWAFPTAWASIAAVLLGGLSGIAVLGFIKPTRGSSRLHAVAAIVAALAYIPLLVAFWRIQIIDSAYLSPYMNYATNPLVFGDRVHWRLVMALCLLAIFLGIRPSARELVRRSLAMRTRRVDRQTLLAMVGAVLVVSVGDVIRLGSASLGGDAQELFVGVGSLIVLLGSLFLTLGIVSAVFDGLRIRKSIVLPAPSFRQVLRGPDAADD